VEAHQERQPLSGIPASTETREALPHRQSEIYAEPLRQIAANAQQRACENFRTA